MVLHLRPGLPGLSPGDDPLQLATAELIGDLREAGLPTTETAPAATGTKGALSDLAVTIGGSTAAAGALVRIVNLWLHRDRRRTLTITRDSANGTPEVIEIQGDAISDRTLHEAVQKLLDAEDPT
ncbi:effector-associated constant component EACC1 [Paractinoplanes lichenicola]|uniref:Uncharacterized protein n=1 Tax=Paractinoplanes lichenicola TaxID=2802976 RepID=A0ABS1VVF6_9ACTN|nr:hypothetical protein [Actinoplanes lichenicola]MBL7258430.1 hypothetical protein [Actinoplanes lichenicola]